MPEDDVSDLRDVVDAINRLCDTMKTSTHEEEEYQDCSDAEQSVEVKGTELVNPDEVVVSKVETYVAERWSESNYAQVTDVETVAAVPTQVTHLETVPSEPAQVMNVDPVASVPIENMNVETVPFDPVHVDSVSFVPTKVAEVEIPPPVPERMDRVAVNKDIQGVDKCSYDDTTSKHVVADRVTESVEVVQSAVEAATEKWSDASLTQVEEVEKVVFEAEQVVPCEPVSEMYYTASSEVSLLSDLELAERIPQEDSLEVRDDRNSVIAGHVAAMRERFESMTRTNTPCPDLMRSTSPSLDVFRNITPSPDHIG